MSEIENLAIVVGREARKLRTAGGWTLDDVASRARRRGLKWTTARVVEFENGKIPLSIATLVIICEALTDHKSGIGERPVKLADLIPDSGEVALNPSFTTDAAIIKEILAGGEIINGSLSGEAANMNLAGEALGAWQSIKAARYLKPEGVDNRVMLSIERQHGLAEKRLAKSLGITNYELTVCEAQLWEKSLSAERSQRADRNATPQKLGRITRDLKEEIKQHIEKRRREYNGND